MTRFVMIVLAGLIVLTILSGAPNLVTILPVLLVGWISFLGRTLPAVEVNWNGIGMGIVCSALGVCLLHGLGQWALRSLENADSPPGERRRWSWRWTLGLYVSFWLLFVIIMGTAGLSRHVQWLIESDEPWRVVRPHS